MRQRHPPPTRVRANGLRSWLAVVPHAWRWLEVCTSFPDQALQALHQVVTENIAGAKDGRKDHRALRGLAAKPLKPEFPTSNTKPSFEKATIGWLVVRRVLGKTVH